MLMPFPARGGGEPLLTRLCGLEARAGFSLCAGRQAAVTWQRFSGGCGPVGGRGEARGRGPHETLASHHCPYQQQLGSRQINMTGPGHLSQNIYFITPLHRSLSTFATISGMCRASNLDPLVSLGLGDKVPHSLCDGVPVNAKHLQQLRRLPASWHLAHGQAGDGDARLAHQGRAHGLT